MQNRKNEVAADAWIERVENPVSDAEIFKVPDFQAPEIAAFPLLRAPPVDMKGHIACKPEVFDGERIEQLLAALQLMKERQDFGPCLRVRFRDRRQIVLRSGRDDDAVDDTLGGISAQSGDRRFIEGTRILHSRARFFERNILKIKDSFLTSRLSQRNRVA